MMNKGHLLLLFCTLLFFPTGGRSQEVVITQGRAKVGTAGLQFLKIGVGARAIGMGEAFVAVADDATAIYYNPAGLTQCENKEVFLTHVEWPADIRYEFGALVLPLSGIGVVGVSFAILTTDDMKKTVPYRGWTGEYFSAGDYAAGISFSRMLTDKFSFGGTVKYVAEYLDNETAGNWAADVGTLFNIGYKNMKLGMSITNFGPDLTFIEEQLPLPINFKMGASMEAVRTRYSVLNLAIEGRHPYDNLEQVILGVEYIFHDMLALRTGFTTNIEPDEYDKVEEPLEGFSFGAGVKVPFQQREVRADFAYTDLGYLDKALRISMAFTF